MANLVRKNAVGPGAEVLVSAGKKWLKFVNGLPNFTGNEYIDKAYKDCLGSRTRVYPDGSVLVMKRGHGIPDRVTAVVPEGVVAPPTEGRYFVGVDVWDAGRSNIIGMLVSRADSLSAWAFVPSLGIPAPTEYRSGTREGLAYGATIGRYAELLPNLLSADKTATLTNTAGAVAYTNTVTHTSHAAYPAGRVLPGGIAPFEGDQVCGTSYLDYTGNWRFGEASQCSSKWLGQSSPGTDVVALGTAIGVSDCEQTFTYTVTIHSVSYQIGTLITDQYGDSGFKTGTFEYPLLNDGWEYGKWTNINAVEGLLSVSAIAATSIDGTQFDYLLCPKATATREANTWRTYNPSGVFEADESTKANAPYVNEVVVRFLGMEHVLESTIATGILADDNRYISATGPKYYDDGRNKFYLSGYVDRNAAVPLPLNNACVSLVMDGTSHVHRFSAVGGSSGPYPLVDLGSAGTGYADVGRIRLLQRT